MFNFASSRQRRDGLSRINPKGHRASSNFAKTRGCSGLSAIPQGMYPSRTISSILRKQSKLHLICMKKTLLLFLAAMLSLTTLADSRSAQQMMLIAKQKLGTSVTLVSSHASRAKSSGCNSTCCYAVYNAADGKGFAIVGADDRLPEIIGYSTSGSFADDCMAPQLKALLEDMQDGLSSGTAEYEARSAQQQSVDYLITSSWGQNNPYNKLCPQYNGTTCPTGCVATALSQVINYWGRQGVFSQVGKDTITWVTQDNSNKENNTTLTVDLTRPVEFDKILDKYLVGQVYANGEDDAVAWLTATCGALCKMQYGTGGSSSQLAFLDAVEQSYDFAPGSKTVVSSFYTDDEWRDMIYNELSHRRPIVYSAYKKKGGSGHSFVLDGNDSQGYVHVNWGWDGMCNAYYSLDLMLPSNETATAYGEGGYTQAAGMVINFCPEAVEQHSEYVCKKIGYDIKSQSLRIYGLTAFSHCRRADLAFRLVNKQTQKADTIIYKMPEGVSVFPETLSMGTDMNDCVADVVPDLSAVGDGTYTLSILSHDPEENGCTLIRTFSNVCQTVELTIQDNVVTAAVQDSVNYDKLTATLDVVNETGPIAGCSVKLRQIISNYTGFECRNSAMAMYYVDAKYEYVFDGLHDNDIAKTPYKLLASFNQSFKADCKDTLIVTCTIPEAGKYVVFSCGRFQGSVNGYLTHTSVEVAEAHTADLYESFKDVVLTVPETVKLGDSFQIKLTCTPLADMKGMVVLGVKGTDGETWLMASQETEDLYYQQEFTKTVDIPGNLFQTPGKYAHKCYFLANDGRRYYFGVTDPKTYDYPMINVMSPTDIEEVHGAAIIGNTSKLIKNGHFVIIKNGRQYNALGQKI